MTRNPYAPPKTPVADVSTQQPTHSPASHAPRNWFLRRPALVWIPFMLSSFKLLAVFSVMKDVHYLDAINNGMVSPAHALAGFTYPFLFFVGSALLLFLRRAAILVFAAQLVWGAVRHLGDGPSPVYSDLALVAGICVYCWYLIRRGTLK